MNQTKLVASGRWALLLPAGPRWYSNLLPRIFWLAQLVVMPFRLLSYVVDLVIGAAVIGIVVLVALWWMHLIPDAALSGFMTGIGDRILKLVGHQVN